MKSDLIDERRREYEQAQPDEGRTLKTKWFAVLVVLFFVTWLFLGASGLMPRGLWVIILAALVLTSLAIALFGPRRQMSDRK